MATIAGILLKGSGALATNTYIRVRSSTSPFDGVGVVRGGIAELFVTHATTAAYSFALAQGGYKVNIPATPEFDISVPAGTGTYTLEGVAGTFTPIAPGAYPQFDDLDEARLVTILGSRVDIIEDDFGRPGIFYRGELANYADDGRSGFVDAAGTKFTRVVFE